MHRIMKHKFSPIGFFLIVVCIAACSPRAVESKEGSQVKSSPAAEFVGSRFPEKQLPFRIDPKNETEMLANPIEGKDRTMFFTLWEDDDDLGLYAVARLELFDGMTTIIIREDYMEMVLYIVSFPKGDFSLDKKQILPINYEDIGTFYQDGRLVVEKHSGGSITATTQTYNYTADNSLRMK